MRGDSESYPLFQQANVNEDSSYHHFIINLMRYVAGIANLLA